MEVARITGRDVQRLVSERLEEPDELCLPFRLRDEIHGECPTAQAVGVQAERSDDGVGESGKVEKLRDRLKDATEIHARILC